MEQGAKIGPWHARTRVRGACVCVHMHAHVLSVCVQPRRCEEKILVNLTAGGQKHIT